MFSRIYMNNDWQFFEKFDESILEKKSSAKDFKNVRLPHTVKELPFHYFDESLYQMVSAYRKIIEVPENWKGKRVLLTIDGAAHDSEVFLNGKSLACHHCGYTAFTVDLSENLNYGQENLLVIKVDSNESLNIPPFGLVIDYMTYGGIYRDVYIDVKEEVYFTDVFLKPEVELSNGKISIDSEFEFNKKMEGLTVKQLISLHKKDDYKEFGNFAIHSSEATSKFELSDIELWSPENPVLYDIKNQLFLNGKQIDEKIIPFGFRNFEFKKDGFYLNGKKYKIRGLNRHQSYPYVGYAMPESMQVMDADVLKYELGLNAVRTSHYPQSHYFIDRCDEIGLLVFTEIPGWQHIGGEEWKKQAVENVKDMVIQYRNHTSIFLWGVRINESKDDDEFYKETNAMAHKLDSTRMTGGVKAHKKAHTFEDVYNYNDFSHNGMTPGCEPKKNVVPDMDLPYFISEYNGHMFPTKNFDCEEHRRDHAIRHARVLDAVASYPDICGSFGWCMSDYNTHKDFGSGDRICYHGVLDMWRNPKMAASVYLSQQDEKPVLDVGSSMDIGEHPACFRGETYIFTNADSVKMYKNDRFIKEFKKESSAYKNLKHGPILIDDFVGNAVEEGEKFSKGQARAVKEVLNTVAIKGMKMTPHLVNLVFKLVVIYHMNPASAASYFNKYVGDWGGKSTVYKFEALKDGKVVQTLTKAPMKTSHFELKVDHTELVEKNSYDVACVRIKACDESGNVLNFSNECVQLSCTGPIEIIGPEVISLQGGMFGVYVKTTGSKGKAELTIKGLSSGTEKVAFSVVI
ncbi:MAG: glycoside hydrolase family 2 protein [Treponemataceae bacterium]|nr:glycoside hydrolase family 2 protein [Treponemataceae bacterium]